MTEKTNLIVQDGGFLVVDPRGFGAGIDAPPGTQIIRSSPNLESLGLGNGLFRMEHLGNGWYRIVSDLSDMVFDVAGASQAAGAPIILWPWHGGPNQRFRTKDAPRLSNSAWGYSLVAQHSGKVLDVARTPRLFDADRLVQWDYHGGPNQLFRAFGSPIRPMHSELVLDVVNASQANGTPIIQHTLHGGPNQLFRLEYVQSAEPGLHSFAYRIVVNHSGKVLDVEGASKENGAKLIQWDWHGGRNQQFKIISSNSAFFIVAEHSNKALDVSGASRDLGAPLIQWERHGGSNQRFKL